MVLVLAQSLLSPMELFSSGPMTGCHCPVGVAEDSARPPVLSGLWLVDNIAGVMAFVKGTEHNSSLDHMAQIVHLLLFHLHSRLWFEWVESKSNWTDNIPV